MSQEIVWLVLLIAIVGGVLGSVIYAKWLDKEEEKHSKDHHFKIVNR